MASLDILSNANPPPHPPPVVCCVGMWRPGLWCVGPWCVGHEGLSWLGPDPKGGGLWIPKLSYRTMWFVRAGSAEHFVLGIGQEKFFLSDPMCLY